MTSHHDPAHARWLAAEGERLLAFGRASRHPAGGFAWLDEDGRAELERPRELWITCRMTHVYALSHLQGGEDGELVDHGVRALREVFADSEHGGWFKQVGADGPTVAEKTAYEHAFVVLAASSAVAAGRPVAKALLRDAVEVFDQRFWDDDAGMVVEQWDPAWTRLEDYRGVNATMHSVEALLAAADVLNDASLRRRALRIVERVVHGLARTHDWRLPEHLDPDYRPMLDYNADRPDDAFRPYGATIGHWLEWSRLVLDLRAALGEGAPEWMLPDAQSLFDAAVREGWAVDGADGFVYTVGWDGRPVVRQRMHWVVAEGIATAAALSEVTGDPAYDEHYARWWQHVRDCFIDEEHGSWHHELGPDNRPRGLTWQGKPDVYHAYQATLLPRLPLAPTLATAIAAGRLA